MTPTLYLTRNGLLEPLGQSQVFSYLRGLSRDYAITLITYEKPEDLANNTKMARAREDCERYGIRWLPQRFRHRPRIIAPSLSMLRMIWLARREVKSGHARLIHARSYIPATVAMIVGRVTGVPFIFDMRALWPEELITAKRLKRGSLLYHGIVAMERVCLAQASAVVSLTHAAVDHLKKRYPQELTRKKIVVIPTCADLDRFVPAKHRPDICVIGCLGTMLSGWFRLDWLAAFIAVAAECDPEISFELTTRDNPEKVRKLIDPQSKLRRRIHISPSEPAEVQKILQKQMVSVMFFTDGLGKLGSSPTRMAEFLGCGLPVVANEGIGDVAQIVRDHRIGVLVKGPDRKSMLETWGELQNLLQDPNLAFRCRQTAEEIFSLGSGTSAYATLYSDVLNRDEVPEN